MNPHNARDRGGYLRGVAAAVRALVAVARAREADLRAIRRIPHQLGSAKAEVLFDRVAELDSLHEVARAQVRDAVTGRRPDSNVSAGRDAVARAQQMAADALEVYRHAARTPASWNREPRAHSRPDTTRDVTEHATPDADRATHDSASAYSGSGYSGSEDAGTVTEDDPTPPWENDAAAVAPDRAAPLANWPPWQDAQRIRDPDLVEFSAVLDEVVADAPDSDEWGRWFDENDSLTMIVDEVLDDRQRDTEYSAAGDDLLDSADSGVDLDDAGLPHEEPVAEPGVRDTDGALAEDEASSSAGVRDPLEQAWQALDGITADLAHDPWDHDSGGHDRGDCTAERDVLGDGYGHDSDDGDNDRYDDGRAEPW